MAGARVTTREHLDLRHQQTPRAAVASAPPDRPVRALNAIRARRESTTAPRRGASALDERREPGRSLRWAEFGPATTDAATRARARIGSASCPQVIDAVRLRRITPSRRTTAAVAKRRRADSSADDPRRAIERRDARRAPSRRRRSLGRRTVTRPPGGVTQRPGFNRAGTAEAPTGRPAAP